MRFGSFPPSTSDDSRRPNDRMRLNDGQRWLQQADADHRAGRLTEAVAGYRRCLDLMPWFGRVWHQLGCALYAQGEVQDAEAALRQAHLLEPDSVDTLFRLGMLLQDCWRWAEAEHCYRQILHLHPDHLDVLATLGMLAQARGQMDAALGCYQRVIDFQSPPTASGTSVFHPRRAGLLVRKALLLPTIPASLAEMHAWRQRMEREIDQLAHSGLQLTDPLTEVGHHCYLQAYHGVDDRPFQETLARFYLGACPSLGWVAPHCRPGAPPPDPGRRLRIGFISRYLNFSVIGGLFRGLIARLAAGPFDVAIFQLGVTDGVSTAIASSVHRAERLVGSLEQMRSQIAAAELDIAFYPGLGDAETYFLAFARLAPVQVVSWGQAATTGIPNVDYFLSDRDMDPPGSQADYSEKLICFDGIPAFPQLPTVAAAPGGRAALGFDEGETLYACVQSLFKLHPDFDAVLAGILQADPHGRLILVNVDADAEFPEAWLARFYGAYPDLHGRVVVLPKLTLPDYYCLIEQVDVLLDTPHFSGGQTSLDALAYGRAPVTLPGPTMRSRQTAAFYRKLGIPDVIATDAAHYAALALRLAHDPAWRDSLRHRILARREVLFGREAIVTAMGGFFVAAVTAAREGRLVTEVLE